MTDYYTSASYSQRAPAPQRPVHASDSAIKCSQCGVWIEMGEMDEHICGRRAAPSPSERRRPDMRLELPPPAGRFQANGRLSPRDHFLGVSSPLTPTSNPSSPSHLGHPPSELSRSYSSTSSVSSSSSKLPFFERYQKLVSSGGTGTNMPRSGTSSDIHSLSNSTPPMTPSYTPQITTTPSPSDSPYSRNHTNGYSNRPQPRGASRDRDEESDLPYASSQDDFDSTPSYSSSPPRSREISMPDSSLSSHSGMRRDDSYSSFANQQLKPSHSTPNKLSSYNHTPQRNNTDPPPKRKNSVGGLDACLEDLRLMAHEDDDGGGAQMKDEFFGDGSRRNEDEYQTPRAQRRPGQIPYSRSTPALNAPAQAPVVSNQCVTCKRRVVDQDVQRAGDGQVFCRPCFADRFLPKCRKCSKAIEGGAVTSSDGKVLGKYHPACFSCFTCSATFATSEFYVFDGRPYCQLHYHELNGSLCMDRQCGRPIEGPCVSLVGEENGGGGRYHPQCFKCVTCRVPLPEHHYVLNKLPYCERHAISSPPSGSGYGGEFGGKTSRAKKRQTIITRR